LRLRLRLLAGAIGVLTLSGCSFAFVHGPPANHRRMSFFDCTSGNVLPVVDALVTAASVAATAGAASGDASTRKADMIGYAVDAALFGASAIYGFSKTSDCREAQAELIARLPPTPLEPYMAPPPPVDPWTGRPISPPARAALRPPDPDPGR
jgi:hypothetical protein